MRRSTSASLVSQSYSACHQRRRTSGLVHASKTRWAGASYVRSMWRVGLMAPYGVAAAALSNRARRGAPWPRRSRRGEPPRAARPRYARRSLLAVRVVVVPPPVRRGLRPALGRVLPRLLAAERGHVEVAPDGAERLVSAAVDEVRAEDPVAVADEGVVAVPLVDPEVLVEVVGDRVPGDVLPAVALLQAPDVLLGRARGED